MSSNFGGKNNFTGTPVEGHYGKAMRSAKSFKWAHSDVYPIYGLCFIGAFLVFGTWYKNLAFDYKINFDKSQPLAWAHKEQVSLPIGKAAIDYESGATPDDEYVGTVRGEAEEL